MEILLLWYKGVAGASSFIVYSCAQFFCSNNALDIILFLVNFVWVTLSSPFIGNTVAKAKPEGHSQNYGTWNCSLAVTQRPFFVMLLLPSPFELAKELGKRDSTSFNCGCSSWTWILLFSGTLQSHKKNREIWFYLKCTLDSQGSETWLKLVEEHTWASRGAPRIRLS